MTCAIACLKLNLLYALASLKVPSGTDTTVHARPQTLCYVVQSTLDIRIGLDPTTNGWRAKMEAQSEYARVAHTFLHAWRRLVMLGRVLVSKISASELRRKSIIKSALLVGFREVTVHTHTQYHTHIQTDRHICFLEDAAVAHPVVVSVFVRVCVQVGLSTLFPVFFSLSVFFFWHIPSKTPFFVVW